VTTLQTERLILRRPAEDDLDGFAAVFSIDEVWRYSFQRRALTREETAAWLARHCARWDELGWGLFAVTERDGGHLLGYCGLAIPDFLPEVMPSVEIGYRIHPAYWNRGLVTEAAAAVLAFAFEVVGLDRVVAIYEPDNVGSGRVMEKIGMRFWKDTALPGDGMALRVYDVTRQQWAERTERTPSAGRQGTATPRANTPGEQ
jgi:RimJ/RimL family protein N-acetyltransferase